MEKPKEFWICDQCENVFEWDCAKPHYVPYDSSYCSNKLKRVVEYWAYEKVIEALRFYANADEDDGGKKAHETLKDLGDLHPIQPPPP